jgi:hypothetical protein
MERSSAFAGCKMMKGLFLILYLNFQANRGELKAVVAKCKGLAS